MKAAGLNELPSQVRVCVSDLIDDALFRIKLSPPGRQRHILQRKRLMEVIDRPDTKLFIVRAPAGFGKTTLLEQWKDRLEQAGTPCAWLTLDAADNDPARLLAALSAAIGGTIADARSEIVLAPHDTGPAFVSHLVTRLKHLASPFVLMLDDMDMLQASGSRSIIQMLLQNTPPLLRLVAAGRSIPAIGQSRLRLVDAVADVGGEDLRFHLDETSAFLSSRLRLPLTSGQLSELQHHTEGWPAVLQLASLSIRDEGMAGRVLSTPQILDRGIADYLQEDVLDRQPVHVRNFLLDTCILRQLTGGLCDALTGSEDGDAMLARMHDEGLFLQRIDGGDGRIWYRFHAMFADFLRREAHARSPSRLATLHGAASVWLSDHGMIAAAAEHARLGGDPERALALLDGIAMEHVWQGRLKTVLDWSDGLTVEHARRYERLFGAYLWAEAFVGDLNRAERRLGDLARLAREMDDPSPYIHDTLICLPVLFAGARQDLSAIRRVGSAALAQLTRASSFEHGATANCVAYCELAHGDLSAAQEALMAAKTAWQVPGRTYDVAYTLMFEGALHLSTLDLNEALAVLRYGYDRLSTDHSPLSQSTAIIASCLADALYESGDTGAAQRLLDDHLPMMTEAIPDCLLSGYHAAIRIAVGHANFERARELVQDLEAHGSKRSSPLLVRAARSLHAWLLAVQGEAASARRLLAEVTAVESKLDDTPSPADTVIRHVLGIRTKLQLGLTDGVVAEIDRLIAADHPRPSARRMLRLEILRCLALSLTGSDDQAVAGMATLLGRAVATGAIQCLLDEGEEIVTLVGRLRPTLAGEASPAIARLDSAIARHHGRPHAAETAGAKDKECALITLTARERDILDVVERGLTNNEIAECFSLSTTTVKWHLRNIFDKLGVGNRTEAAFMLRNHRS